MKNLFLALLTSITLLGAQQALATPYAENGDAGNTVATAQSVANGTTTISGNLGSGDSVDVFGFTFGGGYLQIDTQGSVNFDSMLYIFDSFGTLISMNDDYPTCCDSLTGANLAAGSYLMAINNCCSNWGQSLYNFFETGSGWGSYTIHINQAVNSNEVPEPASLALLGLGLLGLVGARRKMKA